MDILEKTLKIYKSGSDLGRALEPYILKNASYGIDYITDQAVDPFFQPQEPSMFSEDPSIGLDMDTPDPGEQVSNIKVLAKHGAVIAIKYLMSYPIKALLNVLKGDIMLFGKEGFNAFLKSKNIPTEVFGKDVLDLLLMLVSYFITSKIIDKAVDKLSASFVEPYILGEKPKIDEDNDESYGDSSYDNEEDYSTDDFSQYKVASLKNEFLRFIKRIPSSDLKKYIRENMPNGKLDKSRLRKNLQREIERGILRRIKR